MKTLLLVLLVLNGLFAVANTVSFVNGGHIYNLIIAFVNMLAAVMCGFSWALNN